MDYGSDDDLLVVTGGVPRPSSATAGGSEGGGGMSPQNDTDFALSLQRQRAEARLASQTADNMRFESQIQNNALRSVVPVPEGLPTSTAASATPRTTAGSSAAARRASSKMLDVNAANQRVGFLEEEVKALNNQLQNQSKGLQRMTLEAEKQSKLISALNARIDKEAALNRDLTARVKLAEAQAAAQKKEVHMMQREASGLTGITSDVRLQKALEEIAQLKAKITTMAANTYHNQGGLGGTSSAIAQQQNDQLIRDKRVLEAQRVELLNCIRKQNKLIEVLRRQKLHLEASKLLQMTEEDFTRVLEAH